MEIIDHSLSEASVLLCFLFKRSNTICIIYSKWEFVGDLLCNACHSISSSLKKPHYKIEKNHSRNSSFLLNNCYILNACVKGLRQDLLSNLITLRTMNKKIR